MRNDVASRSGTILLGSALIILGVLCMVVPRAVGSAGVTTLGLILGVSGLVEAFSGMGGDGAQHRGLLVGGGMLAVAVGFLVMARPTAGAVTVTLLIAGLFFASGLAALAVSLLDRYPGWGWDFLFGGASAILGIVTVWSWPRLTVWVAGYLLGLGILIRGATMLGSTFEPRSALRRTSSRRA